PARAHAAVRGLPGGPPRPRSNAGRDVRSRASVAAGGGKRQGPHGFPRPGGGGLLHRGDALMEIAFWLAVFLILYPPVISPLLVPLLGRLRPRPVVRQPIRPEVTLLLPAYNEAAVIAESVANKLALDYPRDKLQIIVVSDGSTDGTDEIVRGFGD